MQLNHITEQTLSLFENAELITGKLPVGYSQTGFVWSKNSNSLVLATSKQYFSQALSNTQVCAIITTSLFDFEVPEDKSVIVLAEADQLFHYLHNIHQPHREISGGIASSATIASSANISELAIIEENVVVEAGTYIGDFVRIQANSYIGPNCTIGSQGLLPKQVLSKKVHLTHFGGVDIGQNCYIHAGTNISKGLFSKDKTKVGDFTHLGIQVNIAHDASVGNNCDISGNCIIAGRASVENNVFIGSHSCISNWITIGEGSKVKIGSVVINDVAPNTQVSGNYAISHKHHLLKHAKALTKG